ncbi:MAG TPA: CoA pyrophosphatase [Woeseiaceae bacterium]|nr:CoA pyrophosphatase [Woeseiaceae bacterium]
MTAPLITAEHIRASLAGTRPPDDPAAVVAGSSGRDWPAALVERFGNRLQPSAVLIPVIERRRELSVLLTERAAQLTHHPGQISFPGGRMEAGDADLSMTALRETEEEVGIRPDQVDIAGYLACMPTVTGYAVTPIVGLVSPDISLRLDPFEVAQAFEVPLDFLMQPHNQQHSVRRFEGIEMPLVEFRYGPRRIWGATAAMIVSLQTMLLKNN